MITYRNIHASAATLAPLPSPGGEGQGEGEPSALPRLRAVTNSPEREFRIRPGAIEHLPAALIACILFRKAFETVGRDGLAFTIDGARRKYWAENSLVCTTMIGKKVLITYNRHNLDVIHVLTEQGDYIETLPRKGEVDWFDAEATKRELEKHKRVQQRTIDRLNILHEPDSRAALARARSNTEALGGTRSTASHSDPDTSSVRTQRVVQNFPLPESGVQRHAAAARAGQPLNQFPIPAPDASSFETSTPSVYDHRKDDPTVLTGSTVAEDRARPTLNGALASPARTVTLAPAAEAIFSAETSASHQKTFHMEQKQRRHNRAQTITAETEASFLSAEESPIAHCPLPIEEGSNVTFADDINEALEKLL